MKYKLTPEQISDIENALSEYDRIEIEPSDNGKVEIFYVTLTEIVFDESTANDDIE